MSRCFLLFYVSILLGCKSSSLIGYLDNSADGITVTRPINMIPKDHLTITRDAFSNAYGISISEKRYYYARNSFDFQSYEIILAATVNNEIPWSRQIRFVSPVLYSAHIRVDSIWCEYRRSTIYLLLTASELGKDIILSSLTSPAGIAGIFEFGNNNKFIPFQANLIEKQSMCAKVYKCKKLFGSRLAIKSEVEYPISLTINHNQTPNNKKTRLLKPWATIKLPKCFGVSQSNHLLFEKSVIYNSPATYRHYNQSIQ